MHKLRRWCTIYRSVRCFTSAPLPSCRSGSMHTCTLAWHCSHEYRLYVTRRLAGKNRECSPSQSAHRCANSPRDELIAVDNARPSRSSSRVSGAFSRPTVCPLSFSVVPQASGSASRQLEHSIVAAGGSSWRFRASRRPRWRAGAKQGHKRS